MKIVGLTKKGKACSLPNWTGSKTVGRRLPTNTPGRRGHPPCHRPIPPASPGPRPPRASNFGVLARLQVIIATESIRTCAEDECAGRRVVPAVWAFPDQEDLLLLRTRAEKVTRSLRSAKRLVDIVRISDTPLDCKVSDVMVLYTRTIEVSM